MNWTLEHDGLEKTFAEWGFSRLTRKLVSQGADEVSFLADGRPVDAPTLFTPFADTLIIRRDRVREDGVWTGGATWFTGIVIQIPRRGAPDAESNSYRLAGPWWYLETLVFEKTFNIFQGFGVVEGAPTAIYAPQHFSHCFLNLASTTPDTPLGKMTTGQQIVEALQWALKPFVDAGAPQPFQIGTVSPAVNVPFDEVRDITCAEAIHKMLRWSPDAVTWFDYSTSPPTFHCKRRADLVVVDCDINAGNLIHELRVNPRYDLQSSYVLVRYEQIQTVDGLSWMIPTVDQWPDLPPAGPLANFNALRFTVDLQGATVATSRARLVCDAIVPTSREWWLARHPQYRPFGPDPVTEDSDPGNPITSFEIVDGSVQRRPTNAVETDNGFARELTAGQLADWMNFSAQRITVSCKANITYRNGKVVKDHPLTYQCLSTDADTGAFQTQQVSAYAEPVPAGLSHDLYDAVSVLQFEGELTLQEQEVSGGLSVGHLFNLTGGALAEWSAMNAMVQQINEDVDAGMTVVEFGPPRNLNAGELVDLLRVNRNRRVQYSPSLPIAGSGTAASEVELGSNTPEKNSASTPGFTPVHVVSSSIDGSGPIVKSVCDSSNALTQWTKPGLGAGSVLISLADTGGREIKIREVAVCQNGVAGTMRFLCSEFIPDP